MTADEEAKAGGYTRRFSTPLGPFGSRWTVYKKGGFINGATFHALTLIIYDLLFYFGLSILLARIMMTMP